MSDQPTTSSNDGTRGQRFFWIISAYLIGIFLWRVITPAHEYPSRSVQVMEMTFDLGMIVGLSE